jgi:zinc transporter, ZIP family
VDPALAALLYASFAAFAAGLGPLLVLVRGGLPIAWVGWANALASGTMLGVGYALVAAVLPTAPLPAAAGAVLGVVFLALARIAAGGDLDVENLDHTSPLYGYQVLLSNALHAAPEGIAIGAALSVSPAFGVFTAIAIGLHNVPEGAVLMAMLAPRGVKRRHAASLAIAVNVNQVLLAIVTVAIIHAAPSVLPWALGVAFGSLVYLVIAELLPQCYRQAGRTSIALVTVLAMGVVVAMTAGAP